MADASEANTVSKSKVARVIREYDLDGMGAELEEKWTHSDDRYSLRDLATEFNKAVLDAAMRAAGQSVTRHEVEHVFTLLTNEEVSEGAKTQKRRELERDGLDVDQIEGDFVTHQAIHTYLRNYRGVTLDSDDSDPVETARERLERLRNRAVAVTSETIERLAEADHIRTREVETHVEMRVLCESCGTDMDVVTFLDDGGCDCATEHD